MKNTWQIQMQPTWSYNHEADSDDAWTLPLVIGVSKVIIARKTPWKFSLQYWHHVESPDTFGPNYQVITLTVMDIMPTLYLYENVDRHFAEKYWFWFFFTAPAPVPETMVAADPEFYMTVSFFGQRDKIEDAAFANFVRTMSRKNAAHAQCEDYRAAASIDLEHDKADLDKKLTMPMLVLWCDHNPLNKDVDIVSIWKERAFHVGGHGVPSGHWLPEEVPDPLVKEVSAFIDQHSK